MHCRTIPGLALALFGVAAHAQLVGPVTLNDTGMARCVGADGTLSSRCHGTGQDGESGRDATAPAEGNGHAGFKYTKLDVGGRVLARGASRWRCVADGVTGLVWEVKTVNGSVDGAHRHWSNFGDGSAHDTSSLVAEVNAKRLCGAGNWRLPTINELQSLLDYGAASGPAIDTEFFPDTLDGWYWASTGYAGDPASTWGVHFSAAAGGDGAGQRMFKLGARLVHDSKFAPPADGDTRYTFAADEVTDTWTNLVWKRCSVGQTWDGTGCPGKLRGDEWQVALQAATIEANRTGLPWRLPNTKELSSIMDRSRNYPALDTSVFPNSPAVAYYWTSTPSAADPTLAWTLDIRGGYTQTYPATGNALQYRLVRDAVTTP